MMIQTISISTNGARLYEITGEIARFIANCGSIEGGLCTLFIPHTSASLLIQENADISARNDLKNWLNRLVPEDDDIYTHIEEGVDDMPAHIKSMLTQTRLYLLQKPRINGGS